MKSKIKTMIGCYCMMLICVGILSVIDENFSNHLYLVYMAFGFPIVVGIIGLIFVGIHKLKLKKQKE